MNMQYIYMDHIIYNDKTYQDRLRLRAAREAASAFDLELKTMRNTLAAVTSRKDQDYQKLQS